MVIISTMTIMELSIAVVGILGAFGASNCKKVSLCKIIECEKEIKEVELNGNSDFDEALRTIPRK